MPGAGLLGGPQALAGLRRVAGHRAFSGREQNRPPVNHQPRGEAGEKGRPRPDPLGDPHLGAGFPVKTDQFFAIEKVNPPSVRGQGQGRHRPVLFPQCRTGPGVDCHHHSTALLPCPVPVGSFGVVPDEGVPGVEFRLVLEPLVHGEQQHPVRENHFLRELGAREGS